MVAEYASATESVDQQNRDNGQILWVCSLRQNDESAASFTNVRIFLYPC